MAQEWLEWVLNESNETRMLNIITALSAFDRYQASQGMLNAAAFVSHEARKRMMVDVDIHHFDADGSRSWWDFHAPVAWTPLKAVLSLPQLPQFLDHQTEPFTLATYSREASGYYPLVLYKHTRDVSGKTDSSGKVVLITAADYLCSSVLEHLKQTGAAGFITDAFARFDALSGCYWRGRIELAPDSGLFAFSVLPDELCTLRRAADAGVEANIEITIDRNATMPVVSALIPGKHQEREIWVTAHLCHARAGANDNASGVSASLELTALLQQLIEKMGRLRYPLRTIWGPEFLGVAAMQHKRRHQPGPIAVINLDMVGEDQRLCGSPMCVELPLEGFASPLGDMAQTLMQRVFELTAEHSGSWLSMPFQGFSDHALFMNHGETNNNCPAVQLCHINDRFNHTAGDTPDKVSLIEMKRTVAVALALIMQLQNLSPEQISPRRKPSTRKEGGIVGCWTGPLNLRRLIQQLENPLRQVVERLIAEDKRYLSLLHHCALNADGRQREILLDESVRITGLELSEENVATLYAVFDASDYFQVCTADPL
ncbi:DUF4910 domain-containing protein [Dickeya poaceiphila]|uniref:DUF4910 domain-containing protein n=1 Tax=Dickeya poaceiphila TaxID=568768 RepID=A0A5B8I348_9GAMM|nr:DUF4910 domain-containing protein [Dickeya poaceiphila]QDX29068.1 DUF4910 domain-containing protein [Dickeya poaceiphila]